MKKAEINSTVWPLTQGQMAIWLGQQLHADSPLYNVVHTFQFHKGIQEDAFVLAFEKLLDTTDMLRATFYEVDGIPKQQIQEQVQHPLEILDFSHKTNQDYQRWLNQRKRQVLDISKKPFDSVLLKLSAEQYIWYFNVHHSIADAAGITVCFREQLRLYQNIVSQKGEIVALPSYKEFVTQTSNLNTAIGFAKANAYWKERIEEPLTPPVFYGHKTKEQGTASERKHLILGKARTHRIKQLMLRPELRSWTEDSSLFTFFTAILAIFVYRVSGENTLRIGTPSHNRSTQDFKNTVGLLIEFFPMLANLEANDTFRTVLDRIKIESNGFLKNALPGMAKPEFQKSFQVILNYINSDFDLGSDGTTKVEWIHPGHSDPGHYMRCSVYDMEADSAIEIAFDLNEAQFEAETREEVPKHFLNLIDAFIENVDQPIGKPNLSDEPLAIEVLSEQNSELSLHQELNSIGLDNPKDIALVFQGTEISYAELRKAVENLIPELKANGLHKGDVVALYFKRSPEYIITVLACLQMGLPFVPVASDTPEPRLLHILEDAKCALLLTNLKEVKAAIPVLECNVTALLQVENHTSDKVVAEIVPDDIAYLLYTSGSTGLPKGVQISHEGLTNYLFWAKAYYGQRASLDFPLCTSIGFDLTITSTLLPLLSGSKLVIYPEETSGPDMVLLDVLEDNLVTAIKLTPSHLALLNGKTYPQSKLKTIIVGGEDFKVGLAKTIQNSFGKEVKIYNEYGPTEATVGCIVSEYKQEQHQATSVPIGLPINSMGAVILDNHLNPVPKGVIGPLYLYGVGLANGYQNQKKRTAERFIKLPVGDGLRAYRTGDLARRNGAGEFEFIGREDNEVKLNGFRIDLRDVEANLEKHKEVEQATVVLKKGDTKIALNSVENCNECGLPSNYPNTDFDANGVCHLCTAFTNYREKVDRYFKGEDELRTLLLSKKSTGNYDCLALLSGGKDSTYVVARLVNMGLRVLTFTLDNGYISDQAKANINVIVERLGVDHVYGETPHMNKIFVDSLQRHQNVCNGCFKTIYTLSTKLAIENEIPFLVTGLSRGQFFETRLTEELFWDDSIDTQSIDEIILEARKLYHQEDDAVKRLLDVSLFTQDSTFEKVEFVDFYRYSDVSLQEMLRFLKEEAGWQRPTDTGRSTNCLINKAGIRVHKKQKGYSNYAFPYSWDVRLGHKTRTETLDEINEEIDEDEVQVILDEIGYIEPETSSSKQDILIGYYTGSDAISGVDLRQHLKQYLPGYMMPSTFKYLEELPLTQNGKVDRKILSELEMVQLDSEIPYVAPRNEIEELLSGIWSEVLQLKKVGVHDNFVALGGHSLAAIRVSTRINETLELKLPLAKVFELPTIEEYAIYLEETLSSLLGAEAE